MLPTFVRCNSCKTSWHYDLIPALLQTSLVGIAKSGGICILTPFVRNGDSSVCIAPLTVSFYKLYVDIESKLTVTKREGWGVGGIN